MQVLPEVDSGTLLHFRQNAYRRKLLASNSQLLSERAPS